LLIAYFYGHVSDQVLVSAAGRPAVRFRELHHRWSRVSLLDIDLACPTIRVEIAAAGAAPRSSGCSVGVARTVADWCRVTGAVAGVNGGFFGQELGAGRKEIVGLLKLHGRLYARAPRYRRISSLIPPGVRPPSLSAARPKRSSPVSSLSYAHSAFGFDSDGRPAIDWVASDRGRPARLLAFRRPEGLHDGQPWEIESGLSGGPRLIARGRVAVSDRAERLTSDGLLPRTFVGFATEGGTPRFLVIGVATAMSFQDAAEFLDGYFHRFHGIPCAEAMSLDGGPSSQLTYRAHDALHEAQASDVTVPTALLVLADGEEMSKAGLPPAAGR
jgi:hypothetical protein